MSTALALMEALRAGDRVGTGSEVRAMSRRVWTLTCLLFGFLGLHTRLGDVVLDKFLETRAQSFLIWNLETIGGVYYFCTLCTT